MTVIVTPPDIGRMAHRYGVALLADLDPRDAQTHVVEWERASDLAGSPDAANAGIVARLDPGQAILVDELPNDGALRHYRARLARDGFTPSDWTDWISARPVRLQNVPTERPVRVYQVEVRQLQDLTVSAFIESHAGAGSVRIAWTGDPIQPFPAAGAGAVVALDADGNAEVTDLLNLSGAQDPAAAEPAEGWAGPLKVRVTFYSGSAGDGNVLATTRNVDGLVAFSGDPGVSEDFVHQQTQSWQDSYPTNANAGDLLRWWDGSAMHSNADAQRDGTAILVWGRNADAPAATGAIAAFYYTGSSWSLEKLAEDGTAGDHVEFYLDAGRPAVRLYGTTTDETVEVLARVQQVDGDVMRALRGLDPDGRVDGNLNPGVGQDNGTTVVPLTRGYREGQAADGDTVTFSPSFGSIPAMILRGGKTVDGAYRSIVAEGLSVSGFTMRARNITPSSPVAQTDAFGAGTLSTTGASLAVNLDPGDANDNSYTVQYDVDLDFSFGSGAETLEVVVAVDSNDGSGWVTRATRTYFCSGGETNVQNNVTVGINVPDLLLNDDIRVRIDSITRTGGASPYSVTVDPDEVRYTTDSGATDVSATPDAGQTVTWQALEV